LNAPLSQTLDLHGLDLAHSLERAREVIAELPPGGALQLLTSDPELEHPLRELCLQEGLDIFEMSEPATLSFQIYRQF
jgi:TusA-related sulfurtransferase